MDLGMRRSGPASRHATRGAGREGPAKVGEVVGYTAVMLRRVSRTSGSVSTATDGETGYMLSVMRKNASSSSRRFPRMSASAASAPAHRMKNPAVRLTSPPIS